MGSFAPQSVYSNTPSPQTGAGLAALASNQEAIMELPGAQAPQNIEISDNALTFSTTPVSAYLFVDTEGQAAADDLEVINPVVSATDNLHDGMLLHLQAADAGRTVTVVNSSSANGIRTVSGANITLATDTWVTLQLRSGTWYETVSIKDDSFVHLTGAETISGNKTFTGTTVFGANTTGVTATAGDNSTKYATTEYADNAASTAAAGVAVSPSSSTPAARSTSGAIGTSTEYARADHSHPKNWGTSSSVTANAPAVVVETWHSGTEWYRVWSDGWIEQGGITSTFGATDITVNLSKSFSNTNYTVTLAILYASNDMNSNGGWVKSKATTEFEIHSYATAVKAAMWYACGY